MKVKKNQLKVLVVATSRQTRGGITSVISAHEQCDFWREYSVRWIETHTDGNLFVKLFYALKGFFQCVFVFPFYDLIHIHLSEVPSAWRKMPFFLLAKLFRKKTILHFHSFSPQTTVNGRYRGIYHYLFSHADRVIVLSQLWKNWIEQYLHIIDNVVIVYNPCQTTHQIDEADRENIILYAGALNKRKGYEDLIKAFAMIANQCPTWRVAFAGSGEIENGKRIANESGISEQVIFLDWIADEEKDRWFAKARIFCLPSYAEGFPTALLDACSYGLPCVVTPVGGIPDIIVNERNGLLFNPGDIDALSAQLKHLVENPVLREKLGHEAINLAETTFSLKEANRRMQQIYREVISRS
ncbi:MAG: glycosyltransferase family 4 protein [Tannerella sp.]|jgi:glycosyltransferase involved in cell wall biosynthesis|nr:glycosyltransferase family 4 protein [Tannerella sp.]